MTTMPAEGVCAKIESNVGWTGGGGTTVDRRHLEPHLMTTGDERRAAQTSSAQPHSMPPSLLPGPLDTPLKPTGTTERTFSDFNASVGPTVTQGTSRFLGSGALKNPSYPYKDSGQVRVTKEEERPQQVTPRRKKSSSRSGPKPPSFSSLRPPERNPKVFGHIPGIPVGKIWDSRKACSIDGIHAPPVAGIHGSSKEGAYSVVLAGRYDNIDVGDTFTYTGAGGRDGAGKGGFHAEGDQRQDQSFMKNYSNRSMLISLAARKPVRVVRAFETAAQKKTCFRYDGLYRINRAWYERIGDGPKLCRFAFSIIKSEDDHNSSMNRFTLRKKYDDAGELEEMWIEDSDLDHGASSVREAPSRSSCGARSSRDERRHKASRPAKHADELRSTPAGASTSAVKLEDLELLYPPDGDGEVKRGTPSEDYTSDVALKRKREYSTESDPPSDYQVSSSLAGLKFKKRK